MNFYEPPSRLEEGKSLVGKATTKFLDEYDDEDDEVAVSVREKGVLSLVGAIISTCLGVGLFILSMYRSRFCFSLPLRTLNCILLVSEFAQLHSSNWGPIALAGISAFVLLSSIMTICIYAKFDSVSSDHPCLFTLVCLPACLSSLCFLHLVSRMF